MGKKLTEFTENTAPASTDILYMVDDPTGSALTQYVKFGNIYQGMSTITPTLGGDVVSGLYSIGEGTVLTIADDVATSFTPSNSAGVGICSHRTAGGVNYYAIFAYGAIASPFCTLMASGGSAVGTTGALAGTTGTNGAFTYSAHTDGKLYFENRSGLSRSMCVVLLGS